VTWVRGAAIRPVPAYARVGEDTLSKLECELAADSEGPHPSLDESFRRFEETQPRLADKMSDALAKPIDETALALGYFLSIAVWLAFERAFGVRLGEVTRDAWSATVDALALEEDLRRKNADEPLDLDDVLAMEQPDVVAFVHDHIEAALETQELCSDAMAASGGGGGGTAPRDIDVDDVHLVYRMILLETLALSHAVAAGPDEASPELLA